MEKFAGLAAVNRNARSNAPAALRAVPGLCRLVRRYGRARGDITRTWSSWVCCPRRWGRGEPECWCCSGPWPLVRQAGTERVSYGDAVWHEPGPAGRGVAWPGPRAPGAGWGAASPGYLLAQVARGDRAAFASIYDQAAGPVYSLLRRMTGDPSHSEDMTGEVLTEVWRAAPLFSPPAGGGMGWMMAIARRHAVGQVRAALA